MQFATRRAWWLRSVQRTGTLVAAGAALWAVDHFGFDSVLERSMRTLATSALVAADFKLHSSPFTTTLTQEQIDALHARTADRILDVCMKNNGLYIKFGQQVASVPVLPPQYYARFKTLFDAAPIVSTDTVNRIFLEEFGRLPHQIFATFDPTPVASASIAQVHRATLHDGTHVAVKVQKPQIKNQIGWDMWCFRLVLTVFEYAFELPLSWSADYIETHLRQETDFVREGCNSERAAQAIEEMFELRGRVYVPSVHWDQSTQRVLTTEWIDGIRLLDADGFRKNGFSDREAIAALVDVFSDQIFRVGFVHCDPHPGNILVRKLPENTRQSSSWIWNPVSSWLHPLRQQVVLLDHGLYVQCSEKFRHEYALFWRSIFSLDTDTMTSIAKDWGIQDVQLFASATLQRPWRPGQAVHVSAARPHLSDALELHRNARERLKNFLTNTESLPKELVFIARNLNCMRANNKSLGSPVNRINRMANWAVKSLGTGWGAWSTDMTFSNNMDMAPRPSLSSTLLRFVRIDMRYLVFQTTLFLATVGFWVTRVVQYVRSRLFGIRDGGFEEAMDAAARQQLADQMPGLVFDDSMFES